MWRGRFRDDGDVGDAADVQHGAAAARVAIEQIIAEGHERRALSADGHIRGTKIADRGHAGDRGDHSGFADLQTWKRRFRRETGWAGLDERWSGRASR